MRNQKKKGSNKKPCPRCHGTGKMPLTNARNLKRVEEKRVRGIIDSYSQTIECDLCRGGGTIAR